MSVEFISQAPKTPLTACPICREDMQPGDKVLVHKIKETIAHSFHENCLISWTNIHRSCPLCHARISSINGRTILSEAGPLAPANDQVSRVRRGEAVMLAARNGNFAEVLLLLSNGAQIEESARINALESAICTGHIEIVRFLLANGSYRLFSEKKLFELAFSNEDLEIGRLLLDYVNLCNGDLLSIIKEAPSHLRPEVVRLMVESGDINSENLFFAFFIATSNGFIDVPLAQSLLAVRTTIPIEERFWIVYGNCVNRHFGVAGFLLKNWIWSS